MDTTLFFIITTATLPGMLFLWARWYYTNEYKKKIEQDAKDYRNWRTYEANVHIEEERVYVKLIQNLREQIKELETQLAVAKGDVRYTAGEIIGEAIIEPEDTWHPNESH